MHRFRVAMGSTQPVRRSSSCGRSTDAPAARRSTRRPFLDFRSPTEFITGNPCRPAGCPALRRHFLSWTFLPYDTVPGQRVRVSTADPSAATRHVRGLITPCAAITSDPADACASERPWASPFKVFPSSQSVPLSRPLPSCHYRFWRSTPKSPTLSPGRLQGLVPATNPFSHQNHEWFQPSIPSWGSTLQSLLPSDLALTLFVTPPLSPLGDFTFRPARASGCRGTHGWVHPSPDHQLSWASLPSDGHGAPYIVAQGGLIASPHAPPHRSGTM
jgi:hypothetical protein